MEANSRLSNDRYSCNILDKVLLRETEEIVDSEGVLSIKDQIYVVQIGLLTRIIMEDAHNLRYKIHSRSTKMYHLFRKNDV